MGWNCDRSRERIERCLDGLGPITVTPLEREADLWRLLSETNCRSIEGAHVYVDVANFAAVASEATAESDIRRLIQAVHIYQREVSRIVETDDIFDGLRVHFQGAKLHALFYRPYDATEQATRAVLLELVLDEFVRTVFNPEFATENFAVASGSDIGTVIGTQNGVRGDRELLFLGAPANNAAKTIGPAGTLRLTSCIYDVLPKRLRDLCTVVPKTTPVLYEVRLGKGDDLVALCGEFGIGWDPEASRQRVREDRKTFPQSRIGYGDSDELIDLDRLGVTNNKRVIAASIFADVTGFTRFVDDALTDVEKEEALRVLHVIRREFTQVLTDDFNGVRIQFQGDRIQAILHLPARDEPAIAKKVVRAAAGIQSSMEKSLKDCMSSAKTLTVAVGCDLGRTAVSQLGTRGERDPICLGEAVERAAGIEEKIEGREIGVAARLYDLLPSEHQTLFKKVGTIDAYVAKDLTADRLELAEKAAAFTKEAPVFIKSGAAGVSVAAAETTGARPVHPSSNYTE
jgi:class 3 adenylate cyclase